MTSFVLIEFKKCPQCRNYGTVSQGGWWVPMTVSLVKSKRDLELIPMSSELLPYC